MEHLDDLNNICDLKLKQYEKLINLKVDEKYKVLNIEKIKFKYGYSIVVELEEFKVILPRRVLSKMDDKRIEEYNKLDNFYLTVTGTEKFNDKETPTFKFILQ